MPFPLYPSSKMNCLKVNNDDLVAVKSKSSLTYLLDRMNNKIAPQNTRPNPMKAKIEELKLIERNKIVTPVKNTSEVILNSDFAPFRNQESLLKKNNIDTALIRIAAKHKPKINTILFQ